ncbi:MAG: Crp/Fnr family transcriptional regulator [Cyclobacteriaceae bacterium]
MQHLSKGQIIYLPEDVEDTIYFLKKGKVKISKSAPNGRELIIYLLHPGEIFGELALADPGKRDEKAEVMDDAIICGISVTDLEPILAKNPKLNLRITKLIGLRLKKIEHRLECLYFKSGNQRIKDFIIELADNYGRAIGLGFETEVKLHLTHSDIAKLTATSRQAVSTVLSKLEKENTISYNRRRILIKDAEALRG